jgi:hypothetical protein
LLTLGPIDAPPVPLEPLHGLDLLELTGSQIKAARALALHQSTVCRSAALMGEQFRLQPRRGASVCRYGSNESLRLLRLAYRPFASGAVGRDGERAGGAAGVIAVAASEPQTGTADNSKPRKLLLPRRNVTPLLHEALAWHGFQVEQQPISCQDVPSWLKRMHDRQLAMPLCPGLVDPGWIESKGLVPHPERPNLIEQLWLLLPQGLVGSSREARHLIRTLRQRLEKAGEASQAGPAEDASENYATSALLRRHEHGERTASAAVPL